MCFVGDYIIVCYYFLLFLIGVLEEAKFFHISKVFEPLEALIHVSQSVTVHDPEMPLPFCIIAVCEIEFDTSTCFVVRMVSFSFCCCDG